MKSGSVARLQTSQRAWAFMMLAKRWAEAREAAILRGINPKEDRQKCIETLTCLILGFFSF